MGGCKEDRDRLFSVVPSDSKRGNGHKLEHRMFPLNTRQYFCAVQVTKPWHRLSREVEESPPWRASKDSWTRFGQPFLGVPTWAEVWTRWLPVVPPTSTNLRFCAKYRRRPETLDCDKFKEVKNLFISNIMANLHDRALFFTAVRKKTVFKLAFE